MRIVSGRWRGRRLSAPVGLDTRPTSDRVREAVFSILEARGPECVAGSVVLDAFAGSGALGLEALSRGAAAATFVESDPRAVDALHRNVSNVGAEDAVIQQGDVFSLVDKAAVRGGPFSLLFVDPPYRIERAQVRDLLRLMAERDLLVAGALVVDERDARSEAVWPEDFTPVVDRTYGGTAVAVATYARGD